jgi:hypothetical protein
MTTNLDILSFLKASQDARAKEKEEDKETRARERREDMEHILAMIRSGVEKEVIAAMKPIEERIEMQEKVNQELHRKLSALHQQLETIKEDRNSQEGFPALPEPQVQQGHHEGHQSDEKRRQFMNKGWGRGQVIRSSEEVMKEDLCAAARKVIGFSPIGSRMLELQMNSYGARDMEEAKLMEVRSYLKCEMKMLPSAIDNLDIIRIFPPAKQEWNVLYVEFGSENQVDTIFSYTKNMVKKDHRVIRWIPKQMYDRYRAVEGLAYRLRQEEGLKTRVKLGRTDLVLSTRQPESSVWYNRILPNNLPEVNLEQFTSSIQPMESLLSRRTSI